MSENQEKPKKKWHKSWSFIVAGLAIIAIIISLLVVWVVGNQYGTCCDHGWNTARSAMVQAVGAYASTNQGALPTLTDTYTNANCSNCSVVNMSALLTTTNPTSGTLRAVPDGTYASGSGNDNCGGNASLGCKKDNSYIWLVNSAGDVYSYCAGAKCKTNNSGYQDVWP